MTVMRSNLGKLFLGLCLSALMGLGSSDYAEANSCTYGVLAAVEATYNSDTQTGPPGTSVTAAADWVVDFWIDDIFWPQEGHGRASADLATATLGVQGSQYGLGYVVCEASFNDSIQLTGLPGVYDGFLVVQVAGTVTTNLATFTIETGVELTLGATSLLNQTQSLASTPGTIYTYPFNFLLSGNPADDVLHVTANLNSEFRGSSPTVSISNFTFEDITYDLYLSPDLEWSTCSGVLPVRPVPLPGTLVLLSSGLAAIWAWRRHQG